MQILVDGDACPGKLLIEKVAKANDIKVIIYCDLSHNIQSDYSEVIIVDGGFQSVDMYLINNVKANDIVVTQDYGVAAMTLGKKAYAINPKGYIYDEKNIDRLLFERHIAQKVRRAGGKTGTHKKRSIEDDERLENNLRKLIEKYNI